MNSAPSCPPVQTWLAPGTVRTGEADHPGAMVDFGITNTGKRTATEIARIYVQDVKSRADRPGKELPGFQEVSLQPDETKPVSTKLERGAFACIDKQPSAGKEQRAI